MHHHPGTASAEVFQDRERTVVRLDGEIDMATTPMVESVLWAVGSSRPETVVLDVDDVLFMDSAGLKAILAARDRFARAGRSLELRNSPPSVARLFEITGTQL